jgi:protein involved in polysaccharide export with SLBB domain
MRTADSLRNTALAAQIGARLKNGDFTQGDRIVFALLNAPAPLSTLPETLVVGDARTLAFPRFAGFAELSLAGVLRSELAERVTQHFARNLLNPIIRVIPLTRIGVLGSVPRQGPYVVPPEALLSDLITLAGGYTAESDPEKITIRRGAETLMQAKDVRAAMIAGLSVDRLHMLAGDELIVGRKSQRSLFTTFQIVVGFISLIIFTYTNLRRR